MKNLRRNLLWMLVVALLIASLAPFSVVKAQPTDVQVDPQEVQFIVPADTFTVTINVTGATNVNTWEVNLLYNTEILDCTGATEGPFLATGGTTMFDYSLFEATGRVYLVCMLMSSTANANGDGDLVYIDFLVTGVGSSNLNIGEWNSPDLEAHNYLIPPGGAYMEHGSFSGYFINRILSDIRGPDEPDHPPDGTVDMWDFGYIGLAYGKTSADPDWEDYEIADIRGPEDPPGSGLYPPDGVVDMWDFGYCGLQYGQSIY